MAEVNDCEYDREADYVPSCGGGGRREALLYCRQMSGSSVISELTAPTVCESYGTYGSSVASSAPHSVTLSYCDDDGYEDDREGVFFNSGAVVIKRGGGGQRGQRRPQQQHHHQQQQQQHQVQPQSVCFDAFQEEANNFDHFVQNDRQGQGFATDFDGAFSGHQHQGAAGNDEATYGLGQMSLGDKKSQKKIQLRAVAEQLKRNEGSTSCSTSKHSDEGGDWQRRRSESQRKITEDARGFSVESENGNTTTQSQTTSEPHWDDSVDNSNEGPLAKKLTTKAIRSVGNIIKVGGGALLHVTSKKPSNYDGLEDDDGDVRKGFSFGGLVSGGNRRGSLQQATSDSGRRVTNNSDHGGNFADPDRRRSGGIMLDRINEAPLNDDCNFNYSDRMLMGQMGSGNARRR